MSTHVTTSIKTDPIPLITAVIKSLKMKAIAAVLLLLATLSTASYYPACNTAPAQYCARDNCNIWYVDPVHGSANGDGSSAKPWSNFTSALLQVNSTALKALNYNGDIPVPDSFLKPVNPNGVIQGGDVIVLRSGNIGPINIRSYFNKLPITIMGEPGAVPVVDTLSIISASYWNVRCLNITSSNPNLNMNLVDLESQVFGPLYYVSFTENTIYSYESLEPYRHLNQSFMLNATATGIQTRGGQGITISYNYLYHVRFGIVCISDGTVMSHNVLNYVTIDGFDIMHNNTLVEFNLVMNSMNLDNNGYHRDGLQLFTVGDLGILTNITIRNNVFIADQDKNRPFADGFQGISSYDVPLFDVVVENNLVTTIGYYNGIALYYATNCRIISNTVLDVSPKPTLLWITTRHGSGGNVIQNNIAAGFSLLDGVAIENSNAIKKWSQQELADLFVDATNFDLRLKDNGSSPFIGKGNSTNAPETDNNGFIRGGAYDIGCYAFNPINPTPLSPPTASPTTNPSEPITNNNNPSAHVSHAEHIVPFVTLLVTLIVL